MAESDFISHRIIKWILYFDNMHESHQHFATKIPHNQEKNFLIYIRGTTFVINGPMIHEISGVLYKEKELLFAYVKSWETSAHTDI